MQIHPFRPGDKPALRAVFYSSVHELACGHYTAEHLQAWVPRQYDAAQWAERLRGNRRRRGVAKALMAHLCQSAGSRDITRLFADVSQSGFAVEARQRVEVRGVVRANARMVKVLPAHS